MSENFTEIVKRLNDPLAEMYLYEIFELMERALLELKKLGIYEEFKREAIKVEPIKNPIFIAFEEINF